MSRRAAWSCSARSHEATGEDADLPADLLQGCQERLNRILQWPIGHQLAHAVNEGLTASLASDQSKGLEHASDLVDQVHTHLDQTGS